MTRTSIAIPSFTHQTPIPAATRIGPLLVSSIIPPFDPNSRSLPDGVDAQVANLFAKAEEILTAAGGGWDNVAKMTFFVGDIAHRGAINGPWAQRFPDPASRPARHTQVGHMEPGVLVMCDLMAWLGE